MGRFYLDLEFTNGNYYLADIIQMALVAEDSDNVFHTYIKIHYSIPKRVQELTSITDDTLAAIGCRFKDAMVAFIEFIRVEQLQSGTCPTIIAHSGYLHDFPILLANCMKHKFTDFDILHDCVFVDSVRILKDNGYQRPGLYSMCQELGLSRNNHSALEDARLLKTVFTQLPDLLEHSYSYTFIDIMTYLRTKTPVSIQKVYNWARNCRSSAELDLMLVKFVRAKTALSINQVFKISHWYFKDRFVMCK